MLYRLLNIAMCIHALPYLDTNRPVGIAESCLDRQGNRQGGPTYRSLVRREIEFPIFPGFGSLWIVGGSDEYVVHLIDMETARLVGDRQIAFAQAGFFQHVGANGGIA